MIRLIFITLFCGFIGNLYSQDDYYYDPNNDQTLQRRSQYTDVQTNIISDEGSYSSTDRTDGYGSAAQSTNSNSGNTTINNYYYDDDDFDAYAYTNRVRRFYGNNWGVSYYSYTFTPSYYYGWSNWNRGGFVVNTPWYSNQWWRWNRHQWNNTVAYYDPWYDPYWSYNWGWTPGGFYGVSFFPTYSYCGTPYVWNVWGGGFNCYNGWGRSGWCGNGWNNGYYNGYNQGYWNGYYDGYNQGYWNSPYAFGNNGGGWYNPFFNNQQPVNDNKIDVQPVVNTGRPVPTAAQTNIEVPREGITKPFTPTYAPEQAPVDRAKTYTDKEGKVNTTTTPSVIKPDVKSPTGILQNGADKYDTKTGTAVKPMENGIGAGKSNPNVYSAPQTGSGKANSSANEPKSIESPKGGVNVQPAYPNPGTSGGVNKPSVNQPNYNKGGEINSKPEPSYPAKPYAQPTEPAAKPYKERIESTPPVMQQPKSNPKPTNNEPNYQRPSYSEPKTVPSAPKGGSVNPGSYERPAPRERNYNANPGGSNSYQNAMPANRDYNSAPKQNYTPQSQPQKQYNGAPSPDRRVSPQGGSFKRNP